MNTTHNERFNCPVLGGVATIQITRRYMKSDEMPSPVLQRTEFSNCANLMQCGIAPRVGNSFVPDWNKCPAWVGYNKK